MKSVCPVGTFMTKHYIPFLKEKYAPHYPLMKILSKQECGNEREEAFLDNKRWLMRSSDFAEAFTVICDNEIYESHYGNNPNIKCEGSDVAFHQSDNNINNDIEVPKLKQISSHSSPMELSSTHQHASRTCTSSLII